MPVASIDQPPTVLRTECGGGAFTLHSPEPLQPYARCVGEWLEQWARDTPGAPAFAEPAQAGAWTTLSWGTASEIQGSTIVRRKDEASCAG